MTKILINYAVTFLVFVGVDFVWLKFASERLYKPVLGGILADKPRLGAAAVFYLLYVAGIVFFAGLPAQRDGQWTTAAINGGFLGLVCYATYDLTNQATLRDWSVRLTLADMVWGAALTAFAAAVAYFVTRSFAPSA